MDDEPQTGRKVFAKHIPDKGFTSRIYRGLPKPQTGKQTTQLKKKEQKM